MGLDSRARLRRGSSDRVGALVVFGVTTGRHSEFDWLFRGGLARFFPQQWERLAAHVDGAADVPAAYYGS